MAVSRACARALGSFLASSEVSYPWADLDVPSPFLLGGDWFWGCVVDQSVVNENVQGSVAENSAAQETAAQETVADPAASAKVDSANAQGSAAGSSDKAAAEAMYLKTLMNIIGLWKGPQVVRVGGEGMWESDLHHTGLQGKLPHYIFNLHSLETLDLSANSFIGNIPSEISVDITHLIYLNLGRNKLNGTLPSWLFTSPSLKILHLSHNMLSGNVPFESFALPSLKELYLGHNQLVGDIDRQTFSKLTNLTDLRLSYNKFSGEWELGTLLKTLTKLEYLDLSYNGLSVTAKNDNHYVKPGFRYLGLASCKLKVFPPSICNMSYLSYLDISNNSIGGIIPECVIFGSRYIEGLILKGNRLEGEVPHSLSKCRSLKVLDLGNNKLNGTFPEWLGGLSNLQVLLLKSNNFHGPIGISTAIKHAFSHLHVLDLSHNWFVGKLPGKYFQNFKAMQKMVSHSTYPEYLSVGQLEELG
ncbi:leucine-rich repeat protein [Artemisia annua]|uniref:Leucine-rich repeat protein n=1 Tax=Artemisia annua TaxID=35608 RepID=A0A2U1LKF6_ARTAN|nr:leucine-rich repeat protein [Artemisia annua]